MTPVGEPKGRLKSRPEARRRRHREQPMVPEAEFTSYYGRPVIKEPVWKALDVAGYLFLGGLAGASSVLAAGSQLSGYRELARVAKVSALGAISLSAVALIHDLGRPGRFANMLRVFKPSSPMSVGSWLVAGYGPVAGAAAVSEVTGILPKAGAAATLGAGLLGPAVAMPAWHAGYREMPYVFAGSAASAAGGLGLLATRPADAEPARNLAILGATVELIAKRQLIRRLAGSEGPSYEEPGSEGLSLAEPYEVGRTGTILRLAEYLTAGALAGAVLGRRSRVVSALAGGGLGDDQVRDLRGGHGIGQGPEVHDRPAAPPRLVRGGINWRLRLLSSTVTFRSGARYLRATAHQVT
jgi:hypothetical protein